MKFLGEKFVSMTLCASMAMGLSFGATGCSLFKDTSVDDVTVLTEDFCKAIKARKIKDIIACFENDDDQEDIEALINFDDSEYANLYEAIAGTIEYDFDEDSVSASKKDKKGTSEVTFTMVDYEAVYNAAEYRNEEELIAAIESSEEVIEEEVKIKSSLVKIDKENYWVVTNGTDIIEGLYDFGSFVPEYKTYLRDYFTSAACTDWGDESFTNISEMTITLNFDFSDANPDDSWYFNYELYRDSSLVISESGFAVWPTDSYINFAIDTYMTGDDEFLQEGLYTISFYDEDGTEFAYVSQNVYIYVEPEPIETESNDTMRDLVDSMVFVELSMGNRGDAGDYMISGQWLDTGDTDNYTYNYYSAEDTTEISYELDLSADYTGDALCVIVYVEDLDSVINEDSLNDCPVISNGIDYDADYEDTVYTFTYDISNTGAGGYLIYFYTEDGTMIGFNAVGVE